MATMLSRGLLGLALAGLLAGGIGAAEGVDVDKVNTKIADFTLKDARGKPVSLSDFKGKEAVVVVFLSFECPVSNGYSPVLAEMAKAYGKKKVAFLGVVSGADVGDAEVAKHAEEFRLGFPVVRDEKFRVAELLKAKVTPEAFVLDHNRVLRYRGRIDDAYRARLKKNRAVTTHDLKDALDELLAGKAVKTPATEAVGCPIRKEVVARKGGKVTYYRDVLPILQENCQACHRPGEVGPFALMTYKQAVNWAADIKEYTRERRMPPWKPVEGVAFQHERKLTQKEIDTLGAWVDAGTPEGDPRDAPKPKTFTDGWQLGKPDLILTVPGEMTIGASGRDVFRCFVLPTGLKEDRHVVAVEVRPSNKRVVHHTLNFWDLTGRARQLEKEAREKAKGSAGQDRGPGYSAAMGIGFIPQLGKVGGIGGWAPGQRARYLPDGYGWPLPKGADVVLQVHYHRNGRVEKDRTRIGLYFAKKPRVKPYKSMVIAGRFLSIPAGSGRHTVKGAIEVLQDCTLRSVMPHMHMLGKEIKVTLNPPGGKPSTLLAIKDWDYDWQETYYLKEPIPIKAGTRVAVEAVYDNSDGNPNNPFHPPRRVWFGDQTTNEMCFVFLGATSDERPGRLRFRQVGGPVRLPRGGERPAGKEK
jgi:peroxiredoxin/mono/diheme cytochrome c family protein